MTSLNRTQIIDYTTTSQPPVGFAELSEQLGVTPEDLREIAVATAVEAAGLVSHKRSYLQNEAGKVAVSDLKSSAVDPVTEVDQASEQLIRYELQRAVVGSSVLGEEDGTDVSTDGPDVAAELLWVVDPIDGTVNFIYGVPAYSVSIAATFGGVPVAAAVADVAGGTVCSAAVGGDSVEQSFSDATSGGFGRVLRLEEQGPLEGSEATRVALEKTLVATGFSYLAERRKAQAELLVSVLPQVRDIRRIGSAAIDLCHVAAGRIDAYYEHGLGPWDHAAGVLIAARAGATVRMPKLDVYSNEGVLVNAAKPVVHEAFDSMLVEGASGGVLSPVVGS